MKLPSFQVRLLLLTLSCFSFSLAHLVGAKPSQGKAAPQSHGASLHTGPCLAASWSEQNLLRGKELRKGQQMPRHTSIIPHGHLLPSSNLLFFPRQV